MVFRRIIIPAISLILLVFFVSCKAPETNHPASDGDTFTTPTHQNTPIIDPDQNWVIFTKEQAERKEVASWLVTCDGLWTPSEDNIRQLEDNLPAYLSQQASLFSSSSGQLEDYKRQYIGIERTGRQIIFGNFFCSYQRFEWQTNLLFVEDGGDCFFQVEYDVANSAFIGIWVNGES